MSDITQRLLGLFRGASTLDLSDARLTETLARLERFSELGRMTAGFAHDMRTPLHVASSAAEAILEDRPKDKALRENAQLILRNCAHALDALKALLEFSRSGTGVLKEESLDGLARKALALVAKPCADKSVKILWKAGAPPAIRADAPRLLGVVYNLLANALDATPPGGKVTVSTGKVKESVWLAVKDTGAGMTPGELSRVATPFHTTKEGGTGLGLYLSKRVLADHGAQLTFQSKPGAGTTAKVSFPRIPAS